MSPIEIFFRDCITGLKRIASATRGDASLDDVKNEAWVMAHDLAAKGKPLDLALPADQDSMLGKLYGKLVLRMRTRIGLALRLDKDWDKSDDDAGPRLCDTVKGPELSDPAREKIPVLDKGISRALDPPHRTLGGGRTRQTRADCRPPRVGVVVLRPDREQDRGEALQDPAGDTQNRKNSTAA